MRAWADEFPLDEGLIYLNHAAVGVWPRRTRDAVSAFADENMYRGAAGYPAWLKVEQRLREQLKAVLNAESADDIALCKNTSEALSLIAYGLTWRAGDNIVTSNQEFPSNRIVWESLSRAGVELRQADISGDDPEGAMLAMCDARTRLLTVSSVQYASGLRMNLEVLGDYCREHSVLFCVDAIQSLGALKFDLQQCHADFVVADAHKWLLGPEGLALFYSSAEAREQLGLQQYGWHMVEHVGDFDRLTWSIADSARRFEPGSPNMLGIHALHASLSLFEDIGMAAVEAEVLDRANRLMRWVEDEAELQLVTPPDSLRHAGIVSFRCRELDAVGHMQLWQALMRAGLICACRAGAIRFSPHFYSNLEPLAGVWSQVRSSLR
ncbi:aminotransferase class V-fold PLP-dependent enzyme [Mariprofundus erugo]|uniref:aminotransferase class V-fold PLP-dependent enzyme n=1 Tax=Mariprofundus erugo TaxID=2528639 RepID=UPI0010FDC6AC|nr:aminotransferase class V-fold PLP-dependent enzyme [Mariprofundus erugo]TLS73858.1 aminotransferase class V-fold PLP-dependent enzyme [Mariprofundus erugo]